MKKRRSESDKEELGLKNAMWQFEENMRLLVISCPEFS